VPGFELPWLQPIPDRLLGVAPEDPAVLAVERSGLRLPVVAALQLLSAKQRAALILRDVLGFSASEVAGILDTSTAAVNSALQRARASFAGPSLDVDSLTEPESEQREIVDRYVAAFEGADIDALARLLAEEVVLEMPPMWNSSVGHALAAQDLVERHWSQASAATASAATSRRFVSGCAHPDRAQLACSDGKSA
jgi:RNA polymerase sigma-70 factor (ECF subfamily)